ncbi:family 78 glycoside hydrolase catalytic domain [Filimonas effusa]|uniref:alpha-L-rhamnosidase n=1 Tax=Filimonas effusa TaxID=2508721 RepID=A0A4Q1DBB8_9BACT|nr:family 78 glycoside hydrolase catalytic domain [Filimonas effusa]RXK86727.1 alpha-L-rhamnosidase [Filimonas effusa]
MYKFTLAILFLFSVNIVGAQSLSLGRLSCENSVNPVGIDVKEPHFGWNIQAAQRNTIQAAYQVLVSDDAALLAAGKGNMWDSKKVNTGASVMVKYAGKPLQAAKQYFWKVRVWDNKGNMSAWSAPAYWRAGLFTKTDWKGAQWIAHDILPDAEKIVPALHGKGDKSLGTSNNILPLLRKTFTVKSPLKKATAFIVGLGQFEMSVNGVKTGDHFLDPGWTKYDKEALYVSFDITDQLASGNNAIGVMLGNGFYYTPRDKRYRKLTSAYGYPKMMCRIQLEYQNGSVEDVISDASWKTAASPVTYSSIYGGEDYDARLEQKGWNTAGFNDAGWNKAKVTDGTPVLKSQMAAPLKIFEHFSPVKTSRLSEGVYVFDMGQNASGIPMISVQGKRGDTIRIIPAELLAEDGSASQKATGKPAYYDYILKGEGIEEWQPRFTYYGLRYIQIEGAAPEGAAGSNNVLKEVKMLHTRNAAEQCGAFISSNDLFNRTSKLIDWSIRSNMVSIFTDCPHRERLGWQEEVHLVGNSIRYNYDIASLCRKVMGDIKTAQTADGLIPATVPEYTIMDFADGVFRDSPEWGSNGVILPWYLYEWYGDVATLKNSYTVMQRYVDYLGSKSKGYIVAHGLSDWYDVGPERSGFSQLTPMGLTATAYYYYDLVIMQRAAKLLGKTADIARYAALAAKVKQAFNDKFFDKNKRQYGTGSQAANAIAVYMKLVEPQYKNAVVENIVKDIRSRNNSLTAGDIGYRYLIQVLADEGRSDVIYDMNSNPDVPGYGYQLAKGATALTESWVASPVVSNNHFMLGHILEWFYSGLAGIKPAEGSVAFNKIVIKPELAGDLTWADAWYDSPYGRIASSWKKEENVFALKVEIPCNTTATVYLPAVKGAAIYESGKLLRNGQAIKVNAEKQGRIPVDVGSGSYIFTIK